MMEDLTMRSEDDYAFADAYIGCHTARLMKQQDLVRLANCADLKAAQTILQELGYSEAKELEDDDIEWFIRHEQTKLYDLIFHDYGPDRLNCSAHIEVPDTLTVEEIDSIQRKAAMKLYQEQNIILTALSVYSVNNRDEEVRKLREEIYRLAMSVEYVIQVHGFYLHKDTDTVQFDVIVDFDASDRMAVYEKVLKLVKEHYPQYKFLCTLDTDFSVSE